LKRVRGIYRLFSALNRHSLSPVERTALLDSAVVRSSALNVRPGRRPCYLLAKR
jgi:L-serine deaminase